MWQDTPSWFGAEEGEVCGSGAAGAHLLVNRRSQNSGTKGSVSGLVAPPLMGIGPGLTMRSFLPGVAFLRDARFAVLLAKVLTPYQIGPCVKEVH